MGMLQRRPSECPFRETIGGQRERQTEAESRTPRDPHSEDERGLESRRDTRGAMPVCARRVLLFGPGGPLWNSASVGQRKEWLAESRSLRGKPSFRDVLTSLKGQRQPCGEGAQTPAHCPPFFSLPPSSCLLS